MSRTTDWIIEQEEKDPGFLERQLDQYGHEPDLPESVTLSESKDDGSSTREF